MQRDGQILQKQDVEILACSSISVEDFCEQDNERDTSGSHGGEYKGDYLLECRPEDGGSKHL
jgi:hypothetical protein